MKASGKDLLSQQKIPLKFVAIYKKHFKLHWRHILGKPIPTEKSKTSWPLIATAQ